MRAIAIKILLGDRAKYLGLIFGVTFSTLLMAQQVSIFIGLMARTASAIYSVSEADIWVMDTRVRYIDVHVGETVKKGRPLFTLDERDINAQIQTLEAALQIAKIQAKEAADNYAIIENLSDPRAISKDETVTI